MKISLNSILVLIASFVLVFFFFSDKSGTYLNGSEVQVYLLIIVTLISLFINAHIKNEFLELLNLIFVVFYIWRIPFIFSDTIECEVITKNVDVNSIPWWITILTLQYLSLVVCIIAVNPKIPRINNNLSELIFKKVLLFSFFILLANIARIAFLPNVTLTNFFSILTAIFTEYNALMLIVISSVMIEEKTFFKYKFFVILFFLLTVSYVTYHGGKAGLLEIILMGYLAMVVVRGPLVFKLHELLVTGVIALISFVLFFVGKLSRVYQAGGTEDQIVDYIGETSLSALFAAVSHRIGYLDFFIEKVSNPIYEPFVSLTYYFKSITDKLTPGFDVFNVPFMSRSIYAAYFGVPEIMNSEQITVFAESHILFGGFSFIFYLLVLFLIKHLLLIYRSPAGFARGLYYINIYYMFYFWLSGYGLDMVLAFSVYQGIFVFLTILLIRYWSQKEWRQV